MEVEINREIMKFVSSFKFLVRFFSDHIGLREDVKSVGEGPPTFYAMKMMFNVRSASLGVERELE